MNFGENWLLSYNTSRSLSTFLDIRMLLNYTLCRNYTFYEEFLDCTS